MNKKLLIAIAVLITVTVSGCGKTEEKTTEPKSEERRVSTIVYYNKTGNIQREDIYSYDEFGNASVSQQIVYAYNDRGKLTNIKREAGGPGYDKDIESYFYMGDNCTQKLIFNDNGSSSEVYYWKYYDSGSVKSETHTIMLTPNVKNEEIKDFDEDGVLLKLTENTQEGYRYHDYIYDDETGLLKEENISFSPTGKKKDTEPDGYRTYSYNENGLLSRTETYNSEGIVTRCILCEYDEKNNPVSTKTYASEEVSDATLISAVTKEYDALGELIFEATTDVFGNGNSIEYRYDSAGNIIRKTERSFGTEESEITTETEYDIHNNPIKQTLSNSSGLKIIEFDCSYEYYDSGTIKICTYYAV